MKRWKRFGIGLGKTLLNASIQQAGMQGLIPRQQPLTKRGLCKKMAQMLANEHQLPKSLRNEVFQGLLGYLDSIEDMIEAQSDSEFTDDWGDDDEDARGVPQGSSNYPSNMDNWAGDGDDPGVAEAALSDPPGGDAF